MVEGLVNYPTEKYYTTENKTILLFVTVVLINDFIIKGVDDICVGRLIFLWDNIILIQIGINDKLVDCLIKVSSGNVIYSLYLFR